jgi:hypothetical protein
MGIGRQHPISIQTPKLVCEPSYRLIFTQITIVFTILCAEISHVRAQETSPVKETIHPLPREVTWTFDSSIMMFNKTLPDESKLDGPAGSFTVGYGRTRGNIWLCGRLHVLSGPWGKARDGAFDADYSGTMLDMEYGAAFPGTNLRSGSGPILSLAGGYLDLSGKNIGGNKQARDGTPNKTLYLEQSFKASVREVTVTPSIGWIWAKPSRPISNAQDQLNTRVEASLVKLGALIPLNSRSQVAITKRNSESGLSEAPQRLTRSGSTKGFALVGSVSLWLGI